MAHLVVVLGGCKHGPCTQKHDSSCSNLVLMQQPRHEAASHRHCCAYSCTPVTVSPPGAACRHCCSCPLTLLSLRQQINGTAMSCRSRDARGKCVYHTNVMMSVGTDVAVICLASLASDAQRRAVLAKLEEHHEVG